MFELPAYRLVPLWWLAGSVLLYLVGSHLDELLARLGRRRDASHATRRPAVRLLLEAAYFVGIPYLALLRGDILPRYVGITGLDWGADLRLAGALAAGCLAGMLLLFWFALPGGGERAARPAWPHPVFLLWRAAATQIHWAFYRAALIGVLGDPYWGAWASLAPLLLERGLHPAVGSRLRDGRLGPAEVARAALLVASTMIYVFVPNLPLLIAFHWLAELGVGLLVRHNTNIISPQRHREHREEVES